MKDIRRWTAVARVLTALAQGLSKVSVALLVLRFAGRIVVWRRLFLYACIASTLLLSVLHGILIYVQCNPIRALWETIPGARCWEPTVINNFAVFLGCRSCRPHPIKLRLSLIRLEHLDRYCSSHRAGQSGMGFAIRYTEKGRVVGRTGGRCCVSSIPSPSSISILITQPSAAGCATLRTYYLSTLTHLTDPTCKALPRKRYLGC